MNENELFLFIRDIRRSCTSDPDCHKCPFLEEDTGGCKLARIPECWDIEEVTTNLLSMVRGE